MLLHAGLPLAIAGTAVMMDLRTARVDNGWILFSMILTLSGQILQNGGEGIFIWLFGTLLPLVILGILFFFRMLGPGDIKLLCALGGALGPENIGTCILCSLLLGGILSLAIVISCGDIRQRLMYLAGYFRSLFLTGKVRPYYRTGMVLENFHFTIPVFMSVMLYVGGVY